MLAYLDDVVILGKSFDDHMVNLRTVFDRFRLHGLKLKPRKCILCRPEVQFLGHRVDSQGLHITEEKIRAVWDWPVPSTRTEVESFLGFINYHRNFIKGLAEVAAPLYGLTGVKAHFVWSEECDAAFRALKELFISAPVLAFPNAKDPFILDTDASGHAVGAALSQIQDGVERPVAFGSLALSPERRRYCTTRKELLAVIMFTRQFRHYLLGRQFTIRTDHHSLVWLMRFKHPEGQLARWLEELSQFDMIIEHRAGVQHQNADGLSRIPIPDSACVSQRSSPGQLPCRGCAYCSRAHQRWAQFEEDVDDVVPLVVRAPYLGGCVPVVEGPAVRAVLTESQGAEVDANTPDDSPDDSQLDFLTLESACWFASYTPKALRDLQAQDSDISPVVRWLESRVDPSARELALSSPAVRHLWLCRPQLEMKEGVLFYRWVAGSRSKLKLVVPEVLKPEALVMVHDSKVGGHPGEDRTLSRLRSSFFWHGSKVDSRAYVQSCAACSRNKKPNVRAKAALGSYVVGGRNERVHLDLLGPFPKSKAGNRYILMMVDQFTKWFECVAIPDQSAEVVAKAFVDQYISRFGPPLEIHTDQGGCFNGSLFQACCKLLDITKTRTTPYRPRSNGQVERYNRVLLPMIRCYLSHGQANWDEHLQVLAMAIRSTVNRSTGFTANMLMLGEEVRTPIDVMLGVTGANLTAKEPASYVSWLRKVLKEVHDEAREALDSHQRRQKRTYDLKLSQHRYRKGDLVYVVDDSTKVGRSSKLHPPWKGPFLIMKVISPVLLEIAGRKEIRIVHHDKVKLCRDRSVPFWLRRRRHELLSLDASLPLSQGSSAPDTTVVVATGSQRNPDLDETIAYEDVDTDLDETLPYEDDSEDDLLFDLVEEWVEGAAEADAEPELAPALTDAFDELKDLGLDSLFREEPVSRSGRVRRRPGYLDDFVE